MEPVQADPLVLAAESVEMLQAAVTVAERAEMVPAGRNGSFPAGAAAAVVVVGGGVMLSHQADPKDTVIDAFKSITAEGQLNPSEEIFGTKELENLLQKGSAQTGMELSMTGISDESPEPDERCGHRSGCEARCGQRTAALLNLSFAVWRRRIGGRTALHG